MTQRIVFRLLAPVVALSAIAAPAYAHPGDHGVDWAAMVAHLITEPDHLALIALAVAVGVMAWRRLGRSERSRH